MSSVNDTHGRRRHLDEHSSYPTTGEPYDHLARGHVYARDQQYALSSALGDSTSRGQAATTVPATITGAAGSGGYSARLRSYQRYHELAHDEQQHQAFTGVDHEYHSRLAVRPDGLQSSADRASAGTPTLRQSATGFPLRSSINDDRFRPLDSGISHHEYHEYQTYHLPPPHPGYPTHEHRPSTGAGSHLAFPSVVSSPRSHAQPPADYSPHLGLARHLPAPHHSTGRPLSARDRLDTIAGNPSFGSGTALPTWDHPRSSWQSTASNGAAIGWPQQDIDGSSTAGSVTRRGTGYPDSGSYEYELAGHVRSAGLAPSSVGLSGGNSNERWSIGEAYRGFPSTAVATPRQEERLTRDYETRERYPTPELVHYPDATTSANASAHLAAKRRRLSGTPVAPSAAVQDWSYPTLAPVWATDTTAQHSLSRQTSPLGTVQPFSYAYEQAGTTGYHAHVEDDQRRFARLLEEEKREVEGRRRRQLVGPSDEAPFRNSLRRIADETRGEYLDDRRYSNGEKVYESMPTKRPTGQVASTSQAPLPSSTRMTRAAAAAAAQAGSQGSAAPSMQSSRPSMSSYRYSNGGMVGSAGLTGGYMNAPPPVSAGGRTHARVFREVVEGKEQDVYAVEDDTPAPLPGQTGGQQKRKASSNAASLRSTATYNGVAGNGLANGYHPPQGNSKRRKPEDGYGYYQGYEDRASAAGSVRNGKAGTAGSTATQSTVNTGVGSTTDRNALPQTGGYGSHYVPTTTRNEYYPPPSTKPYNARPQILPPSRPVYHQPQYAVPADLPAPRLAQAQPQQIPQAPSQSSQGTDAGPPACDDKDGHYIVTQGSFFGPQQKFRIIRLLGQGTFGKVVEATEKNKPMNRVAVKIIRAVPKYREAAGIEIRVLRTLRDNDPENKHKCIHLLDTFDWRNHICLVTPLYGQSVFDFLKENKFQPFPEKHIQSFAASLLDSLKFLHRLNLIHTDLKPENILLVSNAYYQTGDRRANSKSKHILRDTEIRLIDFGSATFDNEFHSSVVSTRHYRAPEIILGLGWSFPCDLFSIGCILVEFYTGDALFQTHDNLEHLAMMEVVMGKMPLPIANRACKTKGEFFKGNKLDYPNAQTTKHSKKFVKAMKPLSEIIKVDNRMTDVTNNFRMQFLDLVTRLLHFDPQRRMSVSTALAHNFFRTVAPAPPPLPKNTISHAPSLPMQK